MNRQQTEEASHMDRITLSSMRLEGRLGVSEEERALPQLVEVDVEVEVDLSAASESDQLADTVDYGPLVEATIRTVETGDYRMLEGLAGDQARTSLTRGPRRVPEHPDPRPASAGLP
jgi:dihydroneopterin aldolase